MHLCLLLECCFRLLLTLVGAVVDCDGLYQFAAAVFILTPCGTEDCVDSRNHIMFANGKMKRIATFSYTQQSEESGLVEDGGCDAYYFQYNIQRGTDFYLQTIGHHYDDVHSGPLLS